MAEDPPNVGKLGDDVAKSCERLTRALDVERALKESSEVSRAQVMAHMATDECAADYLEAMRRYVQAFETLAEERSPQARETLEQRRTSGGKLFTSGLG